MRPAIRFVPLALLLAALAGGQASSPRLARAEGPAPHRPGSVSFLAFGDSGTGGPGQGKVAAAMSRVLEKEPVDFALLLGDNFYPDGLASAEDPLFDSLFVRFYPARSFPFPFYPVLGNHDYHKNAAACLKLGVRDARWRMPARRYAFTAPLGGGDTALFLALDTTALESPARVTPDGNVRPALEGLAEELAAASGARWRFAFGHHVLRSSGLHGDSTALKERLEPLLVAGRVDLWLCGHDHILESLAPAGGIAQITSGGGGGTDRATPILRARSGSLFRLTGGGFVRAEVTRETATFTLYDAEASVRHVRTLVSRPAKREVAP